MSKDGRAVNRRRRFHDSRPSGTNATMNDFMTVRVKMDGIHVRDVTESI